MHDHICLITGAGDGTGAAVARRFSKDGYRTVLIARDQKRLRRLETEIPECRGYACDVGNLESLAETIKSVTSEIGPPSVAIHNAVMAEFKTPLEAHPTEFEKIFRINTTSLLVLAQNVIPNMINQGKGALIVTGNTAAWRGKPNFSMFAPTKAAQRILAQSMARDFGPKGVHVAYLTIDAAIDTPWTRPKLHPNKSDDFFCKPSSIAEEIYHIAHQDASVWSFDYEVRPHHENW